MDIGIVFIIFINAIVIGISIDNPQDRSLWETLELAACLSHLRAHGSSRGLLRHLFAGVSGEEWSLRGPELLLPLGNRSHDIAILAGIC